MHRMDEREKALAARITEAANVIMPNLFSRRAVTVKLKAAGGDAMVNSTWSYFWSPVPDGPEAEQGFVERAAAALTRA